MLRSNNILKLVESESYYESDIDLLNDNKGVHSLHNLYLSLTKLYPCIASYFIKKYSHKNSIVLDPFCGFGTISLEAILNGRIAYASDLNKLALRVTNAKLNPISFAELALGIQLVDVKRLVRLGDFEQYFAPFYDIDTYKEILAVKEYVQNNRFTDSQNLVNFIEVLMLSILHGPTSEFLSTPTYQDVSISPEKQHQINVIHRLTPENKQVISRLLKKASSVLVDHLPSTVLDVISQSKCLLNDARNLSKISSSSVDLILTEPPLFYDTDFTTKMWLRNWFCNINNKNEDYDFFDEESWLDFMNEALMEFARVLKPGKRIVLILRDNYNKRELNTHKLLNELIHNQLSRYFVSEKCLIETKPFEINKEDYNLYKYLVIKRI